MVERIQTENQWARIRSTAAVKKVKKRRPNDGKKKFFKNFEHRYSGKDEESDDLDPLEEEKKRKKTMTASGKAKDDKTDREEDKNRGNNIDILI